MYLIIDLKHYLPTKIFEFMIVRFSGTKNGGRNLKKLVYILIALVVLLGCLAVAVAVGFSQFSEKSVTCDHEPKVIQEEKLTNACSSRPCRNRGRCIDLPGDFICRCSHGYYGSTCEYSVPRIMASKACESSPCGNQGVCTNVPPDDYSCSCKRPHFGKNCQNSESLLNVDTTSITVLHFNCTNGFTHFWIARRGLCMNIETHEHCLT